MVTLLPGPPVESPQLAVCAVSPPHGFPAKIPKDVAGNDLVGWTPVDDPGYWAAAACESAEAGQADRQDLEGLEAIGRERDALTLLIPSAGIAPARPPRNGLIQLVCGPAIMHY